MLLECGCTEPRQWLYLQLFPYIDGIGDIFVQTMAILQAANSLDLSNHLDQCEQTLIEMTNQRKLPIFYDEAQIDGYEMVDMFLSSLQPFPNDENKVIDKKVLFINFWWYIDKLIYLRLTNHRICVHF